VFLCQSIKRDRLSADDAMPANAIAAQVEKQRGWPWSP
jgi:hypothetical protein